MDNSFDKLNNEFADAGRSGGFKYWFWLVISFLCDIVGLFFFAFSFTEKAGNIGMYFSLLTLVFGAFAIQTGAWAKGAGPRTKPIWVTFIWGLVNAALACVVLYIVMPMIKG